MPINPKQIKKTVTNYPIQAANQEKVVKAQVDPPIRLIGLSAQNLLRLEVVELKAPDFEPSTVEITGPNEAGKSSLLDALALTLGGAKLTPKKPIHEGKTSALATVDLTRYKITRKWTKTGTYLELTDAEGLPISSPQRLLDDLVGPDGLAFDPTALLRMKPQEQAAIVRSLNPELAATLDDLSSRRERAYSSRTLVNRDLKAADAAVDACSTDIPKDTPKEEVSVTKIIETRDRVIEISESLESWNNDIDRLAKELAEARNERANWVAVARDEYPKGLPNIGDLTTKFNNVEVINIQVRAAAHLIQATTRYADLKEKSDKLSTRIIAIDGEQAATLAAAKLPVKGLTFDEDGLYLNDIPFAQLSSSKRLRVAVAIGFSQHRPLKLMLIRNGSDLDKASRLELERLVEKHSAQCLIETVDRDTPSAIRIQDGKRVS